MPRYAIDASHTNLKPSISGGKFFLNDHLPDLAVHLSSLNQTLLLREKNLSHFRPGH